MTDNKTKSLDTFLFGSWGRCQPLGVDVPGSASRICPLAREVYDLRGQILLRPPAFGCEAYRTSDCPANGWVIDAAIAEEVEGTNRRFLGDENEPLLGLWFAEANTTIKYFNSMVDIVVQGVKDTLWAAKTPDTSSWCEHRRQLYQQLLAQRRRR